MHCGRARTLTVGCATLVTDHFQIPPYAGPDGRADAELHALAAGLGIQVWTPAAEGSSRTRRALRAVRESPGGRLPPRYATDTWHVPFRPRLQEALAPGIRILDVGAGARPMVAPEDRPEGVTYVGFDIEADELIKAPQGSYDEIAVGDVTVLREELVGQFDLVLSWLTMEHVKPVPDALANLSRYQKPGGRFLGYLAGGRSLHAVLNRVVPHRLAKPVMQRLSGRVPDSVFRAHYDHCWYDALRDIADDAWSQAEVVPLFTGGWYLAFSPVLRAPFLAYEEWAYTGQHRNLAAYYLIDAIA
jgi:SAM-dependent methyltransferase